MSPACEQAYSDTLKYGKALLKSLSKNDVGGGRSHQTGFLIPIDSSYLFTPQRPVSGINHHHSVEVLWQDGRVTPSIVHWYGAAKHEYRLTRFGNDFPWQNNPDLIGQLLILIPKDLTHFNAYVLDSDEDVEELPTALGLELLKPFSIYDKTAEVELDEGGCIDTAFRQFALNSLAMPTGDEFSNATIDTMKDCVSGFDGLNSDDKLMKLLDEEYKLFRLVERRIYSTTISSAFRSVDDFLVPANSILNARKSRAGRSFENHVHHVLESAGLAHTMRARVIRGIPDVIFPNATAYNDLQFPAEKLIVLALKRTCRERWRQIIHEAPRVKTKYLLTIQNSISQQQVAQMAEKNITLVVPESVRSNYPSNVRRDVSSLESFIQMAKKTYA